MASRERHRDHRQGRATVWTLEVTAPLKRRHHVSVCSRKLDRSPTIIARVRVGGSGGCALLIGNPAPRCVTAVVIVARLESGCA